MAVGVAGFGIGFLLTVEGEAGGQLAAGARRWEVEGWRGWWWVCWRCGGYVKRWVAVNVLHVVLSAWLFVGNIMTDEEQGVRVHVIGKVKKGQIERIRAETGDVVF